MPWPKGFQQSAESRAKQGASLSATLRANPELRARIAPWGRVLSVETRAKIAAAHVGMKRTAESRAKQSASRKALGIRWSDERKAAMAARFKGRPSPFPNRRFYYKDIPFRSSYEMRVAKALDALGIAWEFETRRFDLSDSKTYMPDFYLPEMDEYIEVKGYYGPKSATTMSRMFEAHPGVAIAILLEPQVKALEMLAASAPRSVN